MNDHKNSIVELSAFVVILPLLFMILSYTHQTLSLAFRWTMHRSKLAAVYKAIESTKDSQASMERKVKWGRLMLSSSFSSTENPDSPNAAQPIMSQDDLLKYSNQSGRFTIRGENGSGKSTTLMLIKKALAKKAFFLPTHSQLSFLSENNRYSTGESLKKRLEEILEQVEADVLLLDEWDANLDSENRARLSELIDELSRKKCVIEVCHR